MVKIDFNDKSFKGFEEEEDILVDTGVLLAYLNKYDTWYNTVSELFQNHILNDDSAVFLYINPCILNEFAHLTGQHKSIKNYLKNHTDKTLSDDEINDIESGTICAIKVLIENEILIPLEAGKDTYINQLKNYKELGSADAFNASLANEYGISFLTVDNKLVGNIEKNLECFQNIDKIYYTTSDYITY